MRRILLGNSKVSVSAVIMGGWQAGKKDWAGICDSVSEMAVRAALDAGVTAFDTAESYGGGHSERVLGRALRGVRNRVEVLSKVFANHLHEDAVVAACERSLKNLGTDRIDLYQVHWPPGSFGMKPVPHEETMAAFLRLKKDGKILAAGLCNASAEQARLYAENGLLDALQSPLSLFFRAAEKDILPMAASCGAAFLAYSPLAQGFLAAGFGPGLRFEDGDHRARNRLFAPEVFPKVIESAEKIARICNQMGITPAQGALAWVLSRPGTAAVAGARTPGQAEENAGAEKIGLPGPVLAALELAAEPVSALFADQKLMWTPPEKKSKNRDSGARRP